MLTIQGQEWAVYIWHRSKTPFQRNWCASGSGFNRQKIALARENSGRRQQTRHKATEICLTRQANRQTSDKKVQHQLSVVAAAAKAQNLLDNFPTSRDAARLCSSKGKGARAWLNAISTLKAFALSSCKFRLVSFLCLGLPISRSNWTITCNCGADI